MDSSMDIKVTCSECGENLPSEWAHSTVEEKCPKCGSINKLIGLSITESVDFDLHENVKGKLKDRNFNSKKNPRYEFFEGDDLRKNDGKWMKKSRVIDKDNDKYKEVVTDPNSGEVIHENEESLSDHFGHGSAKFKGDNNT
jgi:phage FluMu protein Com